MENPSNEEIEPDANGQEPEPMNADESDASSSGDTVLRDEAAFIQNVAQFYDAELLSDVILKVADLRFFAHKFVLAKSSEVFRAMLYSRAWTHGVTEEVELQEEPECEGVFDKFLRYLYTAEVSINISSAVGILCLADKYNVASLKELCVNYMVENSRSPNVRNALNWYPWAKVLGLERLTEQCTKTISWNVGDIIASPEWVSMDKEFVSDLLQNSELVIENEYAVWEALTTWLTHESRIIDLRELAAELLPLVRFPQMLASQLFALERSDLATGREECSELVRGLLSQAYRYRALCLTQAQLGVTFSDARYLPRDYTELTVDTVQMLNSLRFGIQVDVKMYRGPVPVENRDGDWKITYRKTPAGTWQIQLYGHETAMVNTEARIQPSILIYNEQDKVIQVHRHETTTISRGNCINMTVNLVNPPTARKLSVLIKPVPS